MAKSTHVKVGGVWKPVINVWQRVSGVWEEKVMPYVNVSGVWKECMDYTLLYNGEMVVGERTSQRGNYKGYDNDLMSMVNYGSINPFSSTFYQINVKGYNSVYTFYADYPNIGSNLAHYEFGGTVYTSAENLYNYLDSEVTNTITFKIYVDAQ